MYAVYIRWLWWQHQQLQVSDVDTTHAIIYYFKNARHSAPQHLQAHIFHPYIKDFQAFYCRTQQECERACPSPETLPSVEVTTQTLVDTCQQPLVTGPCRALFYRWGSRNGECVQFIYGGCDGNDNNFRWVRCILVWTFQLQRAFWWCIALWLAGDTTYLRTIHLPSSLYIHVQT